ncbi:MAG TPA: LON peptidase substrate-binding domain-containing protein [Gemmatimonadales bacterium]|nr:LON peptidase substrate-binding domain-containing protein [Gemmatimonadales bacterium]
MPFRLPLFPLSVALFPGNPLPLHIFEPRYRRMLADCLAGDRRFGITPLPDDSEPPGPGAVGCVAEVRVNQELPDGRSNIVVVGGSRFRVSHLLEESQPYLVAMVQTFEDEAGTQPSMEESASLRHLAVQYFAGLRELNDEPPDEVVLPEDSLALTFHVAGSIACDLGIKQRLMEERSTARRLRALLLLLPVLTRSLEKGITVHRQAHSNGKGGSMPDLLSSS